MTRYERLWFKILSAQADSNINFQELCNFLRFIGFEERVKGDHHIFTKTDIEEIINIQPKKIRRNHIR